MPMPRRLHRLWLPTLAAALAACSGNSAAGSAFSNADAGLAQKFDVAVLKDAAAKAGADASAQPDLAVTAAPDVAPTADAAQPPTGQADPCVPCVTEADCAAGQRCAQVQGSSYCAPDCGASATTCSDGLSCVTAPDIAGDQINVCVPLVETCSGSPTTPGGTDNSLVCGDFVGPDVAACCKCSAGKACAANNCYGGYLCNTKTCKCTAPAVACGTASADAGATAADAAGADVSAPVEDAGSPSAPPGTCGALDGPDVASCCKCAAGKACGANNCYGGWYCNHDTCKCQSPPSATSCGAIADVVGSPDIKIADAKVADASKDASKDTNKDTSKDASKDGGSVVVTSVGGKLDSLDFAIVGDTRPPSKNDIKLYPTAVITKIYQSLEAESPAVPFAVTTGDYQFSSPNTANAGPQLDLYLGAQKNYSGMVFHTMGNHECTGAVVSNCGQGNADGMTQTYQIYLQKLLAPLGLQKPYYTVEFQAKDGSWTAKFVFVAANAWDATQEAWLAQELAKPTTYTFVVRHEGDIAAQAPGVTPSNAILKKNAYTLLLAGHTHTFEYLASKKEVITGNGGAPLATSINYGYVVARQRADMALDFHVYDYATHATIASFVVKPDGTPTK